MKTTLCTIVVALVTALPALTQEPKSSASPNPSRETAVLTSTTATVQAVDYAKRELTLKTEMGNTVSFIVDKRIERLNEIKVGDKVRAEYYVSLGAELREPTAEEEANPLTILHGLAKAPPGTEPAAGGLQQIRAVTTVEGLDLPTQTATLKGPRGNYFTVRAQDPENLKKLSLEDTVVVTYTEALAISLEKLPATGESGKTGK